MLQMLASLTLASIWHSYMAEIYYWSYHSTQLQCTQVVQLAFDTASVLTLVVQLAFDTVQLAFKTSSVDTCSATSIRQLQY